jgi:pimeloyl-ACP methyl ester carboxylesterase
LDLAGWDYCDEDLDGIPTAHWRRGSGRPILALHGVGPGTTGFVNFAPLLDMLTASWEVHLIDLIGFGRSGRKMQEPYFDIELWVRQAAQLVQRLGSGPATLLGNSIGGAIALKLAARTPSVRRVIAIAAPAERYPIPPALGRFWSVPESEEELAEIMRPMSAAQAAPAASLVAARFASFADASYRDYFGRMLAGSKQAQLDQAGLTDEEAQAIRAPILLIHGREDRAVPPELTALPLSRRLPTADLTLLAACGHNVLAERTGTAIALIREALAHFASQS